MEYINGMAIRVINAGIASLSSSMSIFTICCIIMNPTMMRAGAVANDGTARNMGDRKSDSRKRKPVTIVVSPVRPP